MHGGLFVFFVDSTQHGRKHKERVMRHLKRRVRRPRNSRTTNGNGKDSGYTAPSRRAVIKAVCRVTGRDHLLVSRLLPTVCPKCRRRALPANGNGRVHLIKLKGRVVMCCKPCAAHRGSPVCTKQCMNGSGVYEWDNDFVSWAVQLVEKQRALVRPR